MARPREALALLTTQQLAELSARKPPTVKRKLQEAGVEPVREEGNALFWDPKQALGVLFGSGDKLDLSDERARLAKEQADAQELKNAEARGELVPRSDVERVLVAAASGLSQRLRGVPSKVAPRVHAAATIAEAEEVIRQEIEEALSELADLAGDVSHGGSGGERASA